MNKLDRLACLKINAPEWYSIPEFQDWLNKANNVATWHTKGNSPGDYSDIFTWYDHHEGSDSNMPEVVWNELCNICDKEGFRSGVIWITNLSG